MKPLAWIGADPGTTGAIAILTEDDEVHIRDYEDDLIEWLQYFDDNYQIDEVVVEKVHSSGQMGVKNSFKFGEAFGRVRGILEATTLKPVLVSPHTWKKIMNLTSDKEMCRMEALRMFPQARMHLTYKKDHNRAEALLLAQYAKMIAR